MGRDKELSGVTGNFCPEDPETRIAEGLRACGHAERVSGQSSYLSALSSMLLLDESQQFPGRTQVGGGVYFALLFIFCFVLWAFFMCGLFVFLPPHSLPPTSPFLFLLVFLLQTVHSSSPVRFSLLEHSTHWPAKCRRNQDSPVRFWF